MILLKLFLLFCGFGLLCLTGGGSLLQFYIDELVTARQWLTLEELGNFMAVSQITPGPIGVNLATFLGFRQAGWAGGLAATIGLLTPSMILMSLATRFYQKGEKSRLVRSLMFGVKPVTVALVASALVACLGMSIFSEQIPIDYFVRKLVGSPEAYAGAFSVCWEMFPVLIGSGLVLYYRKMSIMGVIFSSAAAGMLLHLLFS